MRKLFVALSILTSLSLHSEELKSVVMKGEAYDKNDKLVYIENHTFKMKPSGEITEIQTKYNNPEGKLIAEVSANFEKDPFIPDTTFEDFRFNEKQQLTYDKDSKMITMTVTDKKNTSKSNSIKRTDNMVSGQGFHNFILANFDRQKTDIKFIVLPKLDYYSFYFEKSPSEIAGQRKFTLKISSWVLRALVKEIVVEYREKDRALMSFAGLTNIDTDKHKSQTVRIKLSYPQEKI